MVLQTHQKPPVMLNRDSQLMRMSIFPNSLQGLLYSCRDGEGSLGRPETEGGISLAGGAASFLGSLEARQEERWAAACWPHLEA